MGSGFPTQGEFFLSLVLVLADHTSSCYRLNIGLHPSDFQMVPTLKTSRSLLLALPSNHPSNHYLRQSISQYCLLHWLRCLHLHLLAFLKVHLGQYSKCEMYRSLVLLSRRLLALQRSSRISLRSRFSPSLPSNERPLKLPTNS